VARRSGHWPSYEDTTPPGWSRWLLVRRSLTRNAKGELELACYLCCAPSGTTDEDLIRVAGARWAVEVCFQTAKNETCLDQYQVRRYDAWYRHITLAMLARACLPVTAATAPKALAAASSASRSARPAVSWHTRSPPPPPGTPSGPGPAGAAATSTAPGPATTSEDRPITTKCCWSTSEAPPLTA
jgi:hypothetical protein